MFDDCVIFVKIQRILEGKSTSTKLSLFNADSVAVTITARAKDTHRLGAHLVKRCLRHTHAPNTGSTCILCPYLDMV